MSFPSFSAGEVLTAADMNAVSGWLVKTVTITGTPTAVDVTSCFSADYNNYAITFSSITSVGGNGGTINYKLLSGTTPVTSGFSGNTFFITTGGGAGLTTAPFNNTAFGEACSIGTASLNNGIMQIQAPFLAQYTRSQHNSTDAVYFRLNSMVHAANTSYDGIQFLASAGTFSAGGIIRVYGYRN
jgi:hypothetical protein